MQWALGIDTSSREMSIGLAHKGVPVASFTSYSRATHTELIGDAVLLVLSCEKLHPTDIGIIGVSVGPGSFTGLRIGISFVKGFSLERTPKILPLSSLEIMARAWNMTLPTSSIVVAFDDHKGAMIWNRFRLSDGNIAAEGADRHESKAAFELALGADDVIIVDNAATTPLPETIGASCCVHQAESIALQRGLACAVAASVEPSDSQRWVEARSLEPRYFAVMYAEGSKRI